MQIPFEETYAGKLRAVAPDMTLLEATPIALYTEPKYAFTNAWVNSHQMFAIVFRVDCWRGQLLTETDEKVDALTPTPHPRPLPILQVRQNGEG